VLCRFDELYAASDQLNTEDDLEIILLDACRISNWTVPWEPDGQTLTFRASKIDPRHPEHKRDVGGNNTPGEEQCFRRGFDHGFARAREEVEKLDGAAAILEPIQKEISAWRFAELHDRASQIWGSIAEAAHPCKIRVTSRRSGLSLKRRYAVLQRDSRRCVICGSSAKDGAILEVDHIIPKSKGGTDAIENLQTLCFDCNRGKSDTW
jgi:hypothetical protein